MKTDDGLWDETQLDARDARVRKELRDRLSTIASNIEEHLQRISELEKEQYQLIEVVKAGEWWKLKHLISAADIESLSEIEPMDRNEFLSDD